MEGARLRDQGTSEETMAIIKGTEDTGWNPGGDSRSAEERKELGSSLESEGCADGQEVWVRKGGGEA